ncbi:MAG: polysaccharide deacetylase family protein [Acidimicrobiia bacterium]
MPVDRRHFLFGALATIGLAACGKSGSSDESSGAADQAAATNAATAPATTAPAPATAASTVPPTTVPASTTTAAPSTTARTTAAFRIKAAGTANEVALTFHTDGDLAIANRLVSVLAAHQAPATCFMIGKWLNANQSWARKLLDNGHELANHTYNHLGFASLGAAQMTSEIEQCRDLLRSLTGSPGRWFRPSGTADGTATPSPAVMNAATKAGYLEVAGWDVDPYDYQDPGAAAVRTRTLAGVKAGSVVSLHFGHAGTADALDALLGGLKDKGLTPVTLSKLYRL